jgi:predicted dehydrogenase
MQLTAEQKKIGKENFNHAVGVTRRSFLKGAAAAVPSLGAVYFGYEALKGNPVRVGLIGTGDEGNILITRHPPEYMDIVAIADIRPTNRNRAFHGDNNENRVGLIKKLGHNKAKSIKRYDDHKQLLQNQDVEAVVIAVPLNQHAPIALEALQAGKHVLTEKLMAHNVEQCKQMIKVARENNRLLAVGHQRHYSVLYDNANSLVKTGLLGDIKYIRAQWHRNNSFPGRDSWQKRIPKKDRAALADRVTQYGYDSIEKLVNWRLYQDTGGGLMAELGSHQLDACSIFLGKVNPIAVQGYGGKNFYGVKGIGSKRQQQDSREIDDHVYVTFEFPGLNYADDKHDVIIVTYSSISTNRVEPSGETVFGSRGTLIMSKEQEALLFKEASPRTGPGGLEQRLYVIHGKDGQPVMDAGESPAPGLAVETTLTGKISRGYTEEMEHFCHCIRTQNYGSPAEGGLRCNGTVAMGDAIMALTANLAMKYKKRIVFKPEWFDPNLPAVPESDPDIMG